ncbi:MAG: hypothetical protein ACRD36_05620 [Candidatus Acidiferrum sp.]
MFAPADIKDRLRRQPFLPVQIVTTSGQTYDVYHPDLVLVGQRYLLVGTPSPNDPGIFDRETRLAIIHVAELRDLPGASVSTNGAAG